MNFAFGAGHYTRAKFPMVREEVSWPDYPPLVVIKFRGWDIHRYSGVWKTAPASGTGF